MILAVFILAAIVFLLVLLSMVWPPDSPWSPWWRTSKKKAGILCDMAKITDKDFIYDLGCGDATALIVAARKFGASGTGIEIDPLRYFFSKINVLLNGVSGNIKIVKKNFFGQNISKATVVFVYLVPKTLERLRPKFLKELKPGTKIVSLRYKIDLPLTAKNEKEKIFVYEVP